MKNLLILFFVTGYMNCNGQEENPKPFQNSIAISGGFGLVDLDQIRRLGITYERVLKNDWNLNVSVLTDGSQSSWYAGDVSYNDTTIAISDWGVQRSNQMIKLGTTKNLFEFFYLGADLNIGLCTKTNAIRERQLGYNSEYNVWMNNPTPEVDPSQIYGWYYYIENDIQRYLNYGLSLKIGAQVPLKNRFDLIFQYSPEYIWRAPFNKNLSSTSAFRHFAEMMLCVRI
jgi:hypothetical protein